MRRFLKAIYFLFLITLLVVGCSGGGEQPQTADHEHEREATMTEDGLFIRQEYYESGALKARWTEFAESPGNFVAHGKRTMWYENGRKRFEGRVIYGNPDGFITHWYPNGNKKQEMSYVEGRQNGAVRSWYPDGTLWQEAFFKDDLPHGSAILWDTLGHKLEELSYQNGKKHGICRRWDADGKLFYEAKFENGELVEQAAGEDRKI
ncbi:toxin-antitoxin system YwqK family antitoxin [Candidatus Zixiibacteriota bacterium]